MLSKQKRQASQPAPSTHGSRPCSPHPAAPSPSTQVWLAQGFLRVPQGCVLFESHATAWGPTSPEVVGLEWPPSHRRPGPELPSSSHTHRQHLPPPSLSTETLLGLHLLASFAENSPPKSPCQGGRQEKASSQEQDVSYPQSRPSGYVTPVCVALLGLKGAARVSIPFCLHG